MADEKLRWNELPVNVRRSKHLLYNYLAFGELPAMPETEEDDEEDETSSVNISVTVTDGTSSIGGVSVAIGSVSCTTGNAGGCTLSNVPVGSATVTASKEGYAAYSESVTISSSTETLAIELIELKTYYFKSYADAEGETQWDEGTVETTGVTSNGYTEVEVKTNPDHSSFVGQKFYIASDADADGSTLYPLYTDAGETAADIYVKISETAFE